jgi:exonuclease SbcD
VCGANIRGHETKCTHLIYENIEELGNGYDYLALGHIHHPQAVKGSVRARYSGSPIPMSFDENYRHSVSIVEIEQHDALPSIREVTIEPPVPIYTIPSNNEGIDAILEEIDSLPKGKSYIRVRLKVKDVIPMSERAMIEEKFAGLDAILCEIQPVRETVSTSEQSIFAPEEIKQLSPLDIAMDYYRRQFGEDMSKELQQMLIESIEAVNNADKED